MEEHYYQAPEWFIANHHRYDSFLADGPKVFLGEYASKGNTWFDALAEASFMVGLERNARSVGMACYAPMLCNADYCNWKPDMLWFDNHQLMRTPNYYVQKLFMEHQGDVLLAQEMIGEKKAVPLFPFAEHLTGGLTLSGDESVVEFSHITIANLETGELREIPGTVLSKGSEEQFICSADWANYSISLRAKELEGWKGFQVCYAGQDAGNRFVWTLGGWDNSSSLISEFTHGKDSVLTMKERHIERGRSYRLEIRVQGRTIETFVDGEPETATQSLPPLAEPLYAVSSRERKSGDVIVKLVNVLPKPQLVSVELEGMAAAAGAAYIMSGYDCKAQNVLGEAETVVPREKRVAFAAGTFEWQVPAESVCILRLHDPKQ